MPPLLTKYAPIEQDDNFYKHLVQSQIDKDKSEHKLDCMPLIIAPLSGLHNNIPKVLTFPQVLTLDSSLQKPHSFTPRFYLRLTIPFQGNVPLKVVEQIHFRLCKHHASLWQFCQSLSLLTLPYPREHRFSRPYLLSFQCLPPIKPPQKQESYLSSRRK